MLINMKLRAVASICFVILQFYNTQARMVFEYVKTLDIESSIAAHDNLFILFFDKKDGSTEDIHREFLKAKDMLDNEGLTINVLEYNGKLSQRLETMLSVFKYPKVKFFKKEKSPESYDGVLKAPVIRAWTKTKLRKKSSISNAASNTRQLLSYISNDDKSLVVYWGNPEGELFSDFEKLAKSQKTTFVWTNNKDNKILLEYVHNKLYISNELFTKIEQNDNGDISTILNLNYTDSDTYQAVYFINKYQFSRSFLFSSNKVESNKNSDLMEQIDCVLKADLLTNFKEFNDYLNESKGPLTIAFVLFMTENLSKASEIWTQLQPKGYFDQTVLLDIYNPSNRSGLTNVLKFQQEAFFIVEIQENKEIKKFKSEVDYKDESAKDAIIRFIESYRNGEAEEYIKSKNIKEPVRKNIRELNALNYYAYISKDARKPCMVIYYSSENKAYEALVEYLAANATKLDHMDIFAFDVNNNESREDFSGRSFPYLRIYDESRQNFKSISYTTNKSTIEAFIAEYFKNEEL